jgi:hypothetical protein
MQVGTTGKLCAVIAATWLACVMIPSSAQSPAEAVRKSNDITPTAADTAKSESRQSIDVARERAATLHLAYAATLETIHRYYFRKDQAVLPARAMEDIFSSVARQSQTKARWISVNTKPMSVDHEPATDFEKKAAAELATGKQTYEAIDGGYFRSASSVPLGSGCLSCHAATTFAPPPKGPRYAGLVISIPIKDE